MKSAMRFVAIVVVLCLAFGFGMTVGNRLTNERSSPERPASVSPEAVWAGGADGGMWIRCVPQGGGGALTCTVNATVTGALVENGNYEVDLKTAVPYFYTSSQIGMRISFRRIDVVDGANPR